MTAVESIDRIREFQRAGREAAEMDGERLAEALADLPLDIEVMVDTAKSMLDAASQSAVSAILAIERTGGTEAEMWAWQRAYNAELELSVNATTEAFAARCRAALEQE